MHLVKKLFLIPLFGVSMLSCHSMYAANAANSDLLPILSLPVNRNFPVGSRAYLDVTLPDDFRAQNYRQVGSDKKISNGSVLKFIPQGTDTNWEDTGIYDASQVYPKYITITPMIGLLSKISAKDMLNARERCVRKIDSSAVKIKETSQDEAKYQTASFIMIFTKNGQREMIYAQYFSTAPNETGNTKYHSDCIGIQYSIILSDDAAEDVATFAEIEAFIAHNLTTINF